MPSLTLGTGELPRSHGRGTTAVKLEKAEPCMLRGSRIKGASRDGSATSGTGPCSKHRVREGQGLLGCTNAEVCDAVHALASERDMH